MPDDPLPQSELIICQTEDEKTRIQVRLEGETVWLTQAQMAELFQTTKQDMSLHVQNCFAERELSEISVVKESLTTAFLDARLGFETAASGTRSEPVGTTGGHTDYKSVLQTGSTRGGEKPPDELQRSRSKRQAPLSEAHTHHFRCRRTATSGSGCKFCNNCRRREDFSDESLNL